MFLEIFPGFPPFLYCTILNILQSNNELPLECRLFSKTAFNCFKFINPFVNMPTFQSACCLLKFQAQNDLKKAERNQQSERKLKSNYYCALYKNVCKYQISISTKLITQLSGQRLALGNQRFSVRVWLLTMCRGDFSAVTAWLMSKCL